MDTQTQAAGVVIHPARFFDRNLGRALLPIVTGLSGWAEHGVVEHRFAVENPSSYAELVERYNHTANPGQRVRTRTASLHIAQTLGALRDQGLVQHRMAEATGCWSFDRTISAWAHSTAIASGATLTWDAYARSLGIDPQVWPLQDLLP